MFSKPFRTLRTRAAAVAALFALSAALVACGGAAAGGEGGPAKLADVKPGDMPPNGDWTGVYFDLVNGKIHLVKDGDTVEGCWRNKEGDAVGRLNGKVEGNLVRYEWTEQKVGQLDPNATRSGRGYFVYGPPREGEQADRISGQRGAGKDEVGKGEWDGVKQKFSKPNCKELSKGVADEAPTSGGNWE